jgi:perosamine synthetase
MTALPRELARPLPYGRQTIDDDDVAAVVEVLGSDWLTTGPKVREFEAAVAAAAGAADAVAVSSGTAALHAAMAALRIGPGDEVIVPPLTFAASANCVLYQGGTPVFADVDPDTLLLDPEAAARSVTPRTRAIVAVDYAGQTCDYDALRALAEANGLALVADACHSLGARDRGRPAGSLAALSTFSFHPVKHVTTAEGGAVAVDDPELARRLRSFRNHGITTDHRERAVQGAWFYEQVELGFNYRLSDLQCALGLSQLGKLERFVARRRELAARYDEALAALPGVEPLRTRAGVEHAYHLYVVRVERRDEVFAALRARGIGANVHYVPVHLHPYYRERLGTGPGLCPVAEAAFSRILSLPLFPAMDDGDVDRVVAALAEAT